MKCDILSAECDRKEAEILNLLEAHFQGKKHGVCCVRVPKDLDGIWEVNGMVEIDGKDNDFLAEFKDCKLSVKTEVITWLF